MGNTVGSRELLIPFIARKQQTLWVNPHQLEILFGTVLGDAYVSPLGKIRIEHGIRQQDYLMWKYEELSSIPYDTLPTKIQRVGRRTGKHYESLFFSTRQYFRSLRGLFYVEKRKIFPKNLKLTPLTLAVWYMDDGCYEKKKNRCILATDNFDQESIDRIQLSLRKTFSLETILRPSGKLVFPKRSLSVFFSIIQQHIIPTMEYKIR